MAFNSGTDVNYFIRHKEYFDDKLIVHLEQQQNQIINLKGKIKIHQATHIRMAQKLVDSQFKLKDTKISLWNMKAQCKHKDNELSEVEIMRNELEELKQELIEDLNDIKKEHQRQYEYIQELERENKKLKDKLGLHSLNSSIPSSAQGFRVVKSTREKTERKVGGQKGHTAHTTKWESKPDKVIKKRVQTVPTGARACCDKEGTILYYATQEINMVFKTEVIETRYYLDKAEGTSLPKETIQTYKINSVNYATNFKSHVLYLASTGVIARQRLCTMLSTLSKGQIQLKPSTIKQWEKDFHYLAEGAKEHITKKLLASDIVYADESGWKIDGKGEWVQILTNANYALYKMVDQRGNDPEGMLPILEKYKGILSHDHFLPYYKLRDCIHVECNSHVLRYLQQGIDLDDSSACVEMKRLLQTMLHERNKLMRQGIYEFDDQVKEGYRQKYRKILEEELTRYEKRNPTVKNKKYELAHIKLFRRLKDYEKEHLRFIENFHIPFSNNHAEKGIRQIKIHKKVSGQSKTMEGAQALGTLTSIIQTCNLQGLNPMEVIRTILSGGTVKFLN